MTIIARLAAPCKAYAGQTTYANLLATSSRKVGGNDVYVITYFCLPGEHYGWATFKNREWKTLAGALRAAAKVGAVVV